MNPLDQAAIARTNRLVLQDALMRIPLHTSVTVEANPIDWVSFNQESLLDWLKRHQLWIFYGAVGVLAISLIRGGRRR